MRNLSHCHFTHHKTTQADPGMNPGIQDCLKEKPFKLNHTTRTNIA